MVKQGTTEMTFLIKMYFLLHYIFIEIYIFVAVAAVLQEELLGTYYIQLRFMLTVKLNYLLGNSCLWILYLLVLVWIVEIYYRDCTVVDTVFFKYTREKLPPS